MQLNLTPEEYEEVIDKRSNCLDSEWVDWVCKRFEIEFCKEFTLLVHNVSSIGVWDFFTDKTIERLEDVV